MDSTVKPNKPSVSAAHGGRRSKLIGGIIAVLLMAALGALAWQLTHRAPQGAGGPGGAAGAAGGPGGPGGPGGGGPGGPGGGRGGPSTTVGVATAEQVNIPVTIEALGTVTPGAVATVRPQVAGVLQQINFTEGQMVQAGQVLATIDPRQTQIALLQATGQRQRDEAQLESARLTLSRYKTLLEQDSIARQDVDTQEALVKQLAATVKTDTAAENLARLNLDYAQVKAPISGRVGLRTVDIGNLVGSGDTTGIAVITQLSPIDVEFTVPQDQVPELQGRIAENARLSAVALDRTRSSVLASGQFRALDNQIDVQTGTVRAKARFANTDNKLFPSQFVNLRLEVRTISNAVVVPVNALRHGADGDFVYVLDATARTVAIRKVTRGQSAGDKVQLASGVKAGEQVITEGGDRLKDGAKVTLPGDAPAARGARGARGAGAAGDKQAGDKPADAAQGERPRRQREGAAQ